MSASVMNTGKCEASGSEPRDTSSSSIMTFYKAERLRVMRMRQQCSTEPIASDAKKAASEEMEVEMTNDENVSSNVTLYAEIPHRLVCKRVAHSSPFLVSNVKRMRCE